MLNGLNTERIKKKYLPTLYLSSVNFYEAFTVTVTGHLLLPKAKIFKSIKNSNFSDATRHHPNVIPLCLKRSYATAALLTLCILTKSGVECVCDNKLWEEVKRISFFSGL